MTTLVTWICIVVAACGSTQGTAWWDTRVEASLDRARRRRPDGWAFSHRARPSTGPAWRTW